MDSVKFNKILDKLLEQSEEGKIEWKKTASLHTYLLNLEGSSISILYFAGTIIFSFRNENGETVEQKALSSGNPNYPTAQKLYNLIDTKLSRAEQTIDRILKQLS
jgi:hypothetical protein